MMLCGILIVEPAILLVFIDFNICNCIRNYVAKLQTAIAIQKSPSYFIEWLGWGCTQSSHRSASCSEHTLFEFKSEKELLSLRFSEDFTVRPNFGFVSLAL